MQIRIGGNENVYFYWGRDDVNGAEYNKKWLGKIPDWNWVGLYVDYNGLRADTPTSDQLNDQLRFRWINLETGDVSSEMATYGHDLDTSAWDISGQRTNRSLGDLPSSFTIGGLPNGSRETGHMVASTVVTTLKQGQELPSDAEISMMVRDPMEWLSSYKVGNDYRHPSDRELNTANFTIGSNTSSDATQVWLMGDGSGDAFPSIQNQVNVNSTSTALRLENMDAQDIKSIVTIPVPITTQANSNSGISISLKDATGTTDGLIPDATALEAMLNVSPIQLLSSSETTGQMTWSFNSANEAFDYLANGETLTLTYTLTLSDGESGTTPDTHDIVITINGTNDDPVISGGPDQAALTETDAALSTSGTLTVADIDKSNLVNTSHSLVVSSNNNSALTTDVDGNVVPADPNGSTHAQLLAMLSLDGNPLR